MHQINKFAIISLVNRVVAVRTYEYKSCSITHENMLELTTHIFYVLLWAIGLKISLTVHAVHYYERIANP